MFIKISKTKKCMKKVLFLAIAALAYAGSTNAQTEIAALPAIATDSALKYDGTAIATYRMTNGGTYNFVAKGTSWGAAYNLGATWATYIKGSRLDFKFGTATTNDAVSGIGTDQTLSLTGLSLTANDVITFSETIIDLSDAELCNTTKTYNVTVTNKPTITLTASKALCSPASVPVSIAYNNDNEDYYFRASLSRTGSSPATKLFTNTNQYFSVTDATDGTWNLFSVTGSTPGTYTLTIDEVYDEVSVNATNNSTLGTGSSVSFAIIPTPRPTLATTAVQ
jgi:hypothetical protein